MQIHYIRNIHFTKLLKADGRLREFNFRKLSGDKNENLFSVDVSDDRGNRIIFKMSKPSEAGGWTILPDQKLPEWILEHESDYNSIIEEELAS